MTQDNFQSFMKRLFNFSFGSVIAAMLGFISVPLCTWLLMPEEFGKAAMFLMALPLLVMIVNLGIDQAYLREYHVEKDKNKLLWSSFPISFLFSFFISFLLIILQEDISFLLFDSQEKSTIYLLALALPFLVFQRFNLAIIRIEEKALMFSIFSIMNRLFILAFLLVFLLRFDRSYRGIIKANVYAVFLVCILLFAVNHKKWRKKIRIEKHLILKVLRFGAPLVPSSILFWLFNSMDKIALRTWSDFEQIGLYSAGFRIIAVLMIFRDAFGTFWIPTVYRWHENNIPLEKYQKVSHTLTSTLAVSFGLIVIFRNFVAFILSDKYSGAVPLVPFLLIIPIMYTIAITTSIGINFSRKTYFSIITSAFCFLINLAGNALLVPKYHALGAAVSTGVSYIVFFWISTLISRWLWIKFPVRFYLFNIIIMLEMAVVSSLLNNVYLDLLNLLILCIINKKSIFYLLEKTVTLIKHRNPT